MNKNIDDLKHIRSMMERSSKFLSISGFSGIGAGIFALIGAYVARLLMLGKISFMGDLVKDLLAVAIVVLFAAVACALFFSMRKAKRNKAKFWMPITIQILKDFLVPLTTGGIFCIILIVNQSTVYVAPAMLIFYGLALIAAGSRTYRDIKILGACEIILGLLATIFIHKGLLFWTIGFGILHIIYGIALYWKYDRETQSEQEP